MICEELAFDNSTQATLHTIPFDEKLQCRVPMSERDVIDAVALSEGGIFLLWNSEGQHRLTRHQDALLQHFALPPIQNLESCDRILLEESRPGQLLLLCMGVRSCQESAMTPELAVQIWSADIGK